MKKFFVRICILAVIFAVIDICYGYSCRYLLSNAKSGQNYLDNYICDSTQAEVLIFGSSKAQDQYDPQILEDTLGLTCFNCGRSGMGTIFHYGRWKAISRRYIPKVIVWEFLPIVDLMTRDDNTIFINPLRKYYGEVDGIDSVFWTVDPTEQVKMCSQTYKYHSQLMEAVRNYVHPGGDPGYHPNSLDSNVDPQTEDLHVHYVVDSLKLYYLEKFIMEAKDKTRLIFCSSPMWKMHSSNGFEQLEMLCEKYDIPLINHFTDLDYVDDPTLFHNDAHLNLTGAEKWSKQIAGEIKLVINK